MSGGGGSVSPEIPQELKSLYIEKARDMINLGRENPLTDYLGENPLQVAGLSDLETMARDNATKLWPGEEAAKDRGFLGSAMGKGQDLYWNGSRYEDAAAKDFGAASTWAREMHGTKPAEQHRSNDAVQAAQDRASAPMDYSAEAIANDAGLKAAMEAFDLTQGKEIANNLGSMGLARSTTKGKVLADARSKNATPYVMDAMQRMRGDRDTAIQTNLAAAGAYGQNADRTLNRWNSAIQGAMGAGEGRRGLGQDEIARRTAGAQQELAGAQALAGHSSDIWNQKKGAIDTAMGIGGVERGIEDAGNRAAYEDYLRRQGIAEQALFVPFGQTGNMIGQRSSGK